MPLDDCISTILTLQLLKEKIFNKGMTEVGTLVNRTYDTEMQNVLEVATPHAAELIREQYLHAVNVHFTYYV
ncbi:hypothetical protein F441_02331 [Phytophthora nicotianae CJ01A1]|uniref:Uncharacterized protein n=1 Tax=Phytophthora nicotianae CJ01A1 TaxID=1317063 RepID=W2XQQ9_PHYNI|nr:hypothetical protein F441_02331 [Phytophthora nicotianae CJ01A1]